VVEKSDKKPLRCTISAVGTLRDTLTLKNPKDSKSAIRTFEEQHRVASMGVDKGQIFVLMTESDYNAMTQELIRLKGGV
jgi:hypothetical protein